MDYCEAETLMYAKLACESDQQRRLISFPVYHLFFPCVCACFSGLRSTIDPVVNISFDKELREVIGKELAFREKAAKLYMHFMRLLKLDQNSKSNVPISDFKEIENSFTYAPFRINTVTE
jgi:hypothetical protein